MGLIDGLNKLFGPKPKASIHDPFNPGRTKVKSNNNNLTINLHSRPAIQIGLRLPPTVRPPTQLNSRTQITSALTQIMVSCPMIKNILLLDAEGKRVAVKYFSDDWPTLNTKLAFEKSVFTKTLKTNARTEAEITMFDGCIIVYKFANDLHFFVTAGEEENELITATVLQGFFDAVALLLRSDVEKRTALENLDLILLCIDEIVDGGIILETDADAIAGKVATNGADGSLPFSEQTITQALATAREHLARSLLK